MTPSQTPEKETPRTDEELDSIVENTPFVNQFLAALEHFHCGNDKNLKILNRKDLSYLVNVYLCQHHAQLQRELSEAKREVERLKRKQESRDGKWLDEYGACKVCDGEIPHGHGEHCEILRLENDLRIVTADRNGVMAINEKHRRTIREQSQLLKILLRPEFVSMITRWADGNQVIDKIRSAIESREEETH